jgi:hypothetical protein
MPRGMLPRGVALDVQPYVFCRSIETEFMQ